MEEIKEGNYIRTKSGNIGKVLDITNVTMQKRKKYLIKWNISKAYYITATRIVKHSPNIIDLIEVGDVIIYNSNYLGREIKMEVNYTCKKEDDYKWGEGYVDTVIDEYIMIEDIKTIVTKEQFNQVKYEV